ncbi:hypothetical protein ACMD2_07569 [Ananas comosus]|uniref:Uncharacterized protein n=1 Tax=Ananas comosus TaxID=4615 RepID=A0A199VHZ1_ANACO|nr:hypothetical protein ACMD2_07569 [Ananas comosus]
MKLRKGVEYKGGACGILHVVDYPIIRKEDYTSLGIRRRGDPKKMMSGDGYRLTNTTKGEGVD